MGERQSPNDGKKKSESDDSLGENPAAPGRKRPSDWGVGKDVSRSPGDAGSSPPSKSL